jgi:isopentenyl-diphosphate Delta-isomerase
MRNRFTRPAKAKNTESGSIPSPTSRANHIATDEKLAGESVILVDEHDEVVGFEKKMRAHELGLLHRAFSVFVVNRRNEVLLQRRASTKYHSPGLWSNTACGHPRPGEATVVAAQRRLREEMGVECPLIPVGAFTYSAIFRNGLCEHERDHIFRGSWDGTPAPNVEEVDAWEWSEFTTIERSLANDPASFSAWFALAWTQLKAYQTGGDGDVSRIRSGLNRELK